MQIEEAPRYEQGRDEIMDPVALIREFKRHPQFCEELRRLTELSLDDRLGAGKAGKPGSAAHAGSLGSPLPGVRPHPRSGSWSFYRRWKSSPLWQECGFTDLPHYNAVRTHFIELEEKTDGFKQVKQKLVRHAKGHCPQIWDSSSPTTTPAGSPMRSFSTRRLQICGKCGAEQAAASRGPGRKWRKPGRYSKPNRFRGSFEAERAERG